MLPAADPQLSARAGEISAFGWLRLLLASLVIVSHTPELVDGDRHRELLTRLFGGLSFGELAVDGFFIVSGFLMAGSVLASASRGAFLQKRLVRLYPAFAVSSLICVLVVAPLATGRSPAELTANISNIVFRIAILCPPAALNAFAGTPYPALNGAAWTLQWELGCYLLMLGLARTRLLASARKLFVVALGSLALHALITAQLPGASGPVMDVFRFAGCSCRAPPFSAPRHRCV